jgi:GNAT superfamily N-acetyltransferase
MSAESVPVVIGEVTKVTPELVEAFARLIPQLSSSSPPPGRLELADIVTSEASVLLVAREPGGTIVGSLTLALFRVPTGVRAWIEDVVVDGSARGAGAGEAMVMAAVARAEAAGARPTGSIAVWGSKPGIPMSTVTQWMSRLRAAEARHRNRTAPGAEVG